MHWFYDPSFTEDSSEIARDEGKHLKTLRIRIGEEIAVANGVGKVFFCQMSNPEQAFVSISRTEQRDPVLPRIHLVQALAKGDRDEQALQMAVELGVASVTPWQAEHSIVNWSEKEEKNLRRWQEISISAMKQSQQAFLPVIRPLVRTADITSTGLGLVLEPSAEKRLADIPKGIKELTIVVGPEGGISESERALLKRHGFEEVRLGHSVLRTSTAGPAAMAAIYALTGRW